jgi:hypothetical protein
MMASVGFARHNAAVHQCWPGSLCLAHACRWFLRHRCGVVLHSSNFSLFMLSHRHSMASSFPPFATAEAAAELYPADFHMRVKKGDVTEKV